MRIPSITSPLSKSLFSPPQLKTLKHRLSLSSKSRQRSVTHSHLLTFDCTLDLAKSQKCFFMSEQAILYLGWIGLLGEYCPISRKKTPFLSETVGCMHRAPFQDHTDFSGCYWVQPLVATSEYSLKDSYTPITSLL
ncbi:hypothetical protein L6452_44198 [Arctium lappa]|uniref:Uncharacterized protein n=1 Tax=Arctium lappa TaxID=4217 RepID=A0ACB8XF74_ARCLA|nr:hypothetical protein L6452_44198 [Arctium lappa]